MQWHEFVFSNQSRHRLWCHISFWLLWLVYVIFTIFFTLPLNGGLGGAFTLYQEGLKELGYFQYSVLVLLKSVLLLLSHLFFCYTVIYFFLPNYLFKKKYGHMFVAILLLCLLIIPTGYFLYSLVYPFIDNIFNLQIIQSKRIIIWSSISAGLLSAIKVTLIAVALAIIKRWWLKQKEKEKVEKEKVLTELQLLKAQIHPAFLFSTLNNIIEHAGTASPKSAQMLIKLSDLLSYMLYECDEPEVELEKELNMVKDYMGLEKIRQGERLEMTVRINGDTNRMLITPLILLPFIDNSLSYCNDERLEQAWINLDISIVDNNLFLKVINGLPDGIAKEINNNDQKLVNVQKRLQLLYPGRHEIKINAEQELLMMCLNLKLAEASPTNHIVVEITKTVLGYAGI